jgi:hypothetical protein
VKAEKRSATTDNNPRLAHQRRVIEIWHVIQVCLRTS